MKLTPVGIDIAKSVFQVHYIDQETGEIVNRPIKRAKFLEHFANRAPWPDWDGGVRRSAPLGQATGEDGTPGQADAGGVRQGV